MKWFRVFVKLFLEYGADKTIPNSRGHLAHEYFNEIPEDKELLHELGERY